VARVASRFHGTVVTDRDGVSGPDAVALAVDAAVPDGQHHAGLDLVGLFFAMHDSVTSGNRHLLVFGADPVEPGPQEGVPGGRGR